MEFYRYGVKVSKAKVDGRLCAIVYGVVYLDDLLVITAISRL